MVLTPEEIAFLSATSDTIIPADELSPSGTDCGCVVYIDRQLAGAWGNGARMYRNGPFLQGKAEYGYQLPLTPREFFAAGIAAAAAERGGRAVVDALLSEHRPGASLDGSTSAADDASGRVAKR